MSSYENVMKLEIHVHVFGPLGLAVSRDYSYEPSDPMREFTIDQHASAAISKFEISNGSL